MIAVTCRNGEQFAVDPDGIERVETGSDTVVHMADGAKYVLDRPLEDLMTAVRDARAATLLVRSRLAEDAGALAASVPPAAHRPRRGRLEAPVLVVPPPLQD